MKMSYKVIQWGTGNVGYHSLRHLIRHPHMELVGLHAHSRTKIDKDAAEIAGLNQSTGIIASNDVDALLALKPDAVVYTANGENRPNEAIADMACILSAGINVVSSAMIFLIYPPHADPAMREPLEKACQAGGTTLFINGVDPGFSGDVLPLAALQIADQVEEIRVQEICDYSSYQDPEFTGVSFGFGRPPEYEPIMGIAGVLTAAWGGMVHMIADALDIKLDGIRESYDRFFTQNALDTTMMHVPKGTCAAVHFKLEGMVNEKPVVIAEHVNRLGRDTAPDWPKAPSGRLGVHRCIVTGNPSVQLECFLKGEDGDHNTGGVQATALRLINAIPAVCAHRPGMISTLDLDYTPSKNICISKP